MELVLVRHARPEQVVAVDGGRADPPLTPDGRADAVRLGAWWAARAPRPDVVVASPMRRAHQTAVELAAPLGVPVLLDDRLREFDWGATSYQPPETAGAAAQPAMWQALETGVWGDHRFDPDAFEAGVLAAFAEIVARHSSAVVAVVCHGGVINSFLGSVLQRPRGFFVQPGYTSFSRVLASGDRRQLISINETPHLTGPAAAPRGGEPA